MNRFPRFSDPLITEAFQELEKIEEIVSRDTALATILKVLIHGEPELVRTHLISVTDSWTRYELFTELYGAHGSERDLAQLKGIVPDDHFPDGEDLDDQITLLRIRIATDWRSMPQSCVATSEYRERMLERSADRLKSFRANHAPEIFIFNELCLRISLGEATAIGTARDMAGEDLELRDRIVTSVALGHACSPSPVRARKSLEHVSLPMNRIEVLVTIASVERELGQTQLQDVFH